MAARKKSNPRSSGRKAADRRRSIPATTTGSPARVLARVPKGKRARFHADPGVDQLFAIVTALTAELSVLGERLLTLERVLAKRGGLAPDDIETHEIDDAESALRVQMREGLIERVFQVLETDD
jgi:hypothetical protein